MYVLNAIKNHMAGTNTIIEITNLHSFIDVFLDINFKNIISIDPGKNYFDREQSNRYRSTGANIQYLSGDIEFIIDDAMNSVHSKSIIWINIKMDNNYEMINKYNCDIIRIISKIKNHNIKNHIIFINNMIFFNGNNNCGCNLDKYDLINYIKEINQNYNIFFENSYSKNDIMVAK